jgi:ADP-heptose:LPS heptosyltransferase
VSNMMDTQRLLKKLDPVVWWPACVLGYFLGRLSFAAKRSDRPLIIRPGGMGDLILLCIALEEEGLDGRRFQWLIETRSKKWADYLSLDYRCYDENLFRTLWGMAGRFPVVINSEQRFGLAQAAAEMAVARGGVTTAFVTNRGARLAVHPVPYDPYHTHETIAFRRLLQESLQLGPGNVVRTIRRRKHPATGKPLVGLGGLHAASRSLSEDQWFQLIRDWKGGREFFVVSDATDYAFAQRLAQRFPGQASAIAPPFAEMCRLVQTSAEVFTMDCGFLHIASYFGVPTTAIFTSQREEKWFPFSEQSAMIRRTDLPCQPCALFAQVPKCYHGFACKDLEYRAHKHSVSEASP